jgi:NAD(P)-dependent dehydrogenase (short-subunit alcohol dehydrogenase family)
MVAIDTVRDMQQMKLAGKVALVSGAAGGIGIETVRALEGAGAMVACAVENTDQAARLKHARTLDVRSEGDWNACVAWVEQEFGSVDVVVNNAGVLREASCEDTEESMWDLVHDVNLKGVFLGCKAAIPALRRAGGGAIVNVASIDGIRGNYNHVAYSASKGGVVALTRSLGLELAVDNIRVNAVCPGTVDTPMVQAMLSNFTDHAEAMAFAQQKHPLGRIAQPGEIANVIAFLAGPDSSFMTGMAVPVDGGRSVR